jgi:hypothetical protein
MKRPDPTHVYLSVVNMLRDHGMSRLSGMVDCRVLPALAFPTYLVIAAGEARALVAAMLERVLGREFPPGEARWVLEAEEARRLADYPALVSI